jgi:hypothetical protein
MNAKKPFDDRDEVLARYQHGVMTLLLILAATAMALVVWLGWMFLS